MGYIYKITNDINGKIYIGQTIKTLKERFRQHIWLSKNTEGYYLHRAMKKYGVDNFHISLIEEVDDDLLDEREIYWISKFDSYNNGYNLTVGGSKGGKYDYSLIRNLWDDGLSSHEIQDVVGCSYEVVSCALSDYENYSQKEGMLRGQRKYRKKIAQYTLNGDLVCVYDSIFDIAEVFSEKSGYASAIHFVCRNEKGTAYGYQWRHVFDKPILKISPASIYGGNSDMVNIDGQLYSLRSICLKLYDNNFYQRAKRYQKTHNCSSQEAFDECIRSTNESVIIYKDKFYPNITKAAEDLGITYQKIYYIKRKLKCSAQIAFEIALNRHLNKVARSGDE